MSFVSQMRVGPGEEAGFSRTWALWDSSLIRTPPNPHGSFE